MAMTQMMASATRTQTSTSKATAQPGTPDLDWPEEGNDTSCTKQKDLGQNILPKEVTLPLLAPWGRAGTQVLERGGLQARCWAAAGDSGLTSNT